MAPPETRSRRSFLTGAAGLVGGGLVSVTAHDLLIGPAGAAAARPAIHTRSEWAGALKAKGTLEPERDVRFLLVHHTAGANGYPASAVPATLRGIYSYHTGAKGWKDVAYNFFVDAHGGIWEARTGSLDGPVVVDATGGSQGFAQLCCFMGDHQVTPPTAAAQSAMTDLLAWLAGRHGIDLTAGATVTFRSRGSNLHPAGKQVTTPTIAAHRDMSKTTCPGDACYRLVRGELTATAAAKAGATAQAPAGAPTAEAAPAIPAPAIAPAEAVAPTSSLPPASATEVGQHHSPSVVPGPGAEVADRQGQGDALSTGRVLGLGGLGAAGALAGAVLLHRRRKRAEAESDWYSSELLNPRPGVPPAAPDGHEPQPSFPTPSRSEE